MKNLSLPLFVRAIAPAGLLFALNVFMLFVGWFEIVPRIDILMHILGGATIAYAAFQVVFCFIPTPKTRILAILELTTLVMAVALLWEVAEYLVQTNSSLILQMGRIDTAKDIILGTVGGFLTAFFLVQSESWLQSRKQ